MANAIDLSAIGAALDEFGANVSGLVSQMSEDTKSILNGLISGEDQANKLKAAEVLAILNGQQIQVNQEADRKALLKKIGNYVLAGGGIYGAYVLFFKKGKK